MTHCKKLPAGSFSDFATGFATTGKIFEYPSLYTCTNTKESLKITPHHPETKAKKTVKDAQGAANAVQAYVNSRIIETQEIFEDARGFTYKSVRFCDLDRICDK